MMWVWLSVWAARPTSMAHHYDETAARAYSAHGRAPGAPHRPGRVRRLVAALAARLDDARGLPRDPAALFSPDLPPAPRELP